MKKIISLFILVLLLAGAVQPNNCYIKYTWYCPEYLALYGNCNSTEIGLNTLAQDNVQYIVQWRVVGTETWTVEIIDTPSIQINNLPCDTQFELQIGSTWKYSNSALCYTDSIILDSQLNTTQSCMLMY